MQVISQVNAALTSVPVFLQHLSRKLDLAEELITFSTDTRFREAKIIIPNPE